MRGAQCMCFAARTYSFMFGRSSRNGNATLSPEATWSVSSNDQSFWRISSSALRCWGRSVAAAHSSTGTRHWLQNEAGAVVPKRDLHDEGARWESASGRIRGIAALAENKVQASLGVPLKRVVGEAQVRHPWERLRAPLPRVSRLHLDFVLPSDVDRYRRHGLKREAIEVHHDVRGALLRSREGREQGAGGSPFRRLPLGHVKRALLVLLQHIILGLGRSLAHSQGQRHASGVLHDIRRQVGRHARDVSPLEVRLEI
eukprot:scaffold2534_cov260-Pinguiococcus_pyrenoidosus.AAC.25